MCMQWAVQLLYQESLLGVHEMHELIIEHEKNFGGWGMYTFTQSLLHVSASTPFTHMCTPTSASAVHTLRSPLRVMLPRARQQWRVRRQRSENTGGGRAQTMAGEHK